MVALAACVARAESTNTLALVRTISLPGVAGRLDHLATDVQHNRLFVAALGNNSVEVLDFQAGKRIETIEDCPKPQGLLFAPKANLLYVASGDDGRVRVYDCDSFRTIKTIGPLPDADNIRYDAPSGRIYVGFGDGSLAVLNAMSGVHTYSIKVAGHPESFQIEQTGGRIFVNVPDAHHIAVIDRLNRVVTETWSVQKYEGNFPMALDEPNHRLFLGYRKPARLVVLDTTRGKAVADSEISGDVDDLFYDAKHKRLYLACGEGFVDVVEQRSADDYARVEKLATKPGARTGLFIPEQDLLCVAVPAVNRDPAEVRVFRAKP